MVQDTHENCFTLILRSSDVERDYACQENVDYEKLAAFVAATQVLANYSRAKENRGTL